MDSNHPKCSFCGKWAAAVKSLIQAPRITSTEQKIDKPDCKLKLSVSIRAYICNECILTSASIVMEMFIAQSIQHIPEFSAELKRISEMLEQVPVCFECGSLMTKDSATWRCKNCGGTKGISPGSVEAHGNER